MEYAVLSTAFWLDLVILTRFVILMALAYVHWHKYLLWKHELRHLSNLQTFAGNILCGAVLWVISRNAHHSLEMLRIIWEMFQSDWEKLLHPYCPLVHSECVWILGRYYLTSYNRSVLSASHEELNPSERICVRLVLTCAALICHEQLLVHRCLPPQFLKDEKHGRTFWVTEMRTVMQCSAVS